jgi:hypothetical protein
VDQPAGKGVLELRDAQWAPLREAYERTRDPGVLVRPACLSDPEVVAAAARAAADRVREVLPHRPRFVALGDEVSVTRHGNPLDLCFSPHCRAAFAAFLRARHGELAALNRAWGTTLASWDDVAPLTTDQIRRRELGGATLPQNLRPWAEHREFMDERLRSAVAAMLSAVRGVAPDLPAGLTGMQAPAAFGGHDHCRLAPGLSLVEAYDVGGAEALVRGLAPGAMRLGTLGPAPADSPQEMVAGRLAQWIAHGTDNVVVWNLDTVLDQDGSLTRFGQRVTDAFRHLRAAAELCAGAQVETDPVWIVESQASVRAWWMLDSAQDGATWVRRLSSYEAAHSTSQKARSGWLRLLQDLGLQPTFVPETGLAEVLLRENPRCLVLGAAIALSDRNCQAIAAWVRSGGTLLCDHTPALYDEHLVLRRAGALDELFGVAQRTMAWDSLLVRQGRAAESARISSGASAAEGGLRGSLADARGGFHVFVEQNVGRGRAVYLNLAVCDYDRVRLDPAAIAAALDLRGRVRGVVRSCGVLPPFEVRGDGLPTCIERVVLRPRGGGRVLVARVHALDRPALLQTLSQRGPLPVVLSLPRPARLRVVGRAGILGPADRFELQIDAWTGLFLEEVGAR